MIFSVLLNEWGGGQQLEGVDAKDVLSSLEKGKDQMESRFGKGQVEDTKVEMIGQDLNIGSNEEEAPLSLEETKPVNSKERELQNGQTEHTLVEDTKEEMVRNGQNAFSNEIVLDNNGVDKEEVPSSLEVTKAVNSQEKGLPKDIDVESQVEDSKEEMVRDGHEAFSKDTKGNWIKDVEKTKREVKRRKQFGKSEKQKPDAEKGGQEGKKGQRKISEKRKRVEKVRRREERKSSKKYLRKEKLRLKQDIFKLKEQREKIKREIRRANQRRRNVNGHGKEKRTNCRKATSRDAECVEKLSSFTSVALAQAPNIIKQVENIF